MGVEASRDGVALTNLDQPLGPDAGATKRDLIDFLDAVAAPLIAAVADRPMTVLRALRGQAPFMQKNTPRYAPDWIATVTVHSEASHRDVRYPLCNDRRTLLWLANQRAVEYHPALWRTAAPHRPTHLVLDLDPPGDDFTAVVAVAALVRRALADCGLRGAAKTSGARGIHVVVPVAAEPTDDTGPSADDVAAATRALAARVEALDPDIATTAYLVADRAGKVFVDSTRAGGATVAAVYSPRLRPGTPVSYPLPWSDLDRVHPRDFTVGTAAAALGGRDPWTQLMPAPQRLPAELIAQGHTIPVARVAAMHEGKRRARARRDGR